MLTPRSPKEAIIDSRFTVPVFTVAEAARLVGMNPSTLSTWAKGYERQVDGRRPVRMGPVITSIADTNGTARVPFIGLVEAAVVQAFRQTDLPLQRIRAALEVLDAQGELEHALASRKLMTNGADVLYDYARETADGQLGLLTVVKSGQRVYTDMIADEWDEVIALCRRIIAVEPHFLEAYNGAAWMLWSMDRDEEAVELYRAGIAANPDRYEIHHEFGMYYRYRQKWDEAVEQFRKSVERGAPGYFQHTLPGTLERGGKKREALAEWRALLERFPDDPIAKRHIEDLESQLGED